MSLKEGLKALQQGNYYQAVELLEAYCQTAANPNLQEYAQAQMALARAYHGTGEKDKAIAILQQLEGHLDSQTSNWAKNFLSTLTRSEQTKPAQIVEDSQPRPKAGRAAQTDVRLISVTGADNLAVASAATAFLFVAVAVVFYLVVRFLFNRTHPFNDLAVVIVVLVVLNGVVFFLSPAIMDFLQKSFYQTRWVNLVELKKRSPEAAEVIKRVCEQKNLNFPRLGIIDNPNPTAFTYGSLPDNVRLVVSQGLFTYLDDDEIAAIYAHELGHVVYRDFAIATAATTLIQVTYLAYAWVRDFSNKIRHQIGQNAIAILAIVPYALYLLGTYLAAYLSRTREYYADRFAAQTTGNPNGLSRALVKIAYGQLEERQGGESQLLEGTRILSPCDPVAAIPVGVAYRLASDPQKIGQVLLWDMFNPWGWWIEMNSTHPLLGKRLRLLTAYAEQLKLETEFDLATSVQAGKKLSKNKLYGNLISDILLYNAQWVGAIAGFILGLLLAMATGNQGTLPSFTFFGFGIGTLLNIFAMYPHFELISPTDMLTLLCDPYASALRGRPVQLQGQIIGRADAGYQFACDLKLSDRTSSIYIRNWSRFGFLGDFLFSTTKIQKLIGAEVKAVGWFRREFSPRVDLAYLKSKGIVRKSYPRFWSFAIAIAAIVFGFIAPHLIKTDFFDSFLW